MPDAQSRRLHDLARKYTYDSEIPPGEAFQHAFRRYLKANRESLLDIVVAAASVQISTGTWPEDLDPLLLKAIYDTNPSLVQSN